MQSLFGSLYLLFKISTTSKIVYSEEFRDRGKTKIRLLNSLQDDLLDFFKIQLEKSLISETEFLETFNSLLVFTSQYEPLQVACQLYWKLAEIIIVGKSATVERTGGERYNKELTFSTNMDIIDSVLSNKVGEIEEEERNLLFNFLTKSSLPVSELEKKIIKVLTIFSEETTYKVRQNGGEIIFQQEGIYQEIIKVNSVESNDSHEQVGPFRILKSVIKENLNFYLEDSTSNGFTLKSGIGQNEFENYFLRVNAMLNLSPKKTTIEILPDEIKEETQHNDTSTNKIYFGAPGTGKSHKVKTLLKGKESRTQRVTFHPDFDYISFIGGYKPTSDKTGEKIRYEFVPQAFTNIYIDAWKNLEENYYLVIEEINRGNCAEIFGDIFQLLDRTSDYPITPSKELGEYLVKELGANTEGIKYGRMKLPPNLNIYATMNTSDQSLFPMDSAFKRRWEWEYIPINYNEYDLEGNSNKSFNFKVLIDERKGFNWIEFIQKVNARIKSNPNLGMDKCIGNYFLIGKDNEILLDQFINKAIFYLWNDVFKDEDDGSIFAENSSYEDFFPIVSEGKKRVEEMLELLEVEITTSSETPTE